MSANPTSPQLVTCDWCGGDGQSMMPGYPCIQCGGDGHIPVQIKPASPDTNCVKRKS